jgi:hypothetical protein
MHAINRSRRDRWLLSAYLPIVGLYIAGNMFVFQYYTLTSLAKDSLSIRECLYYTSALLFIVCYAKTVLSDPGRVKVVVENDALNDSVLDLTKNA